MDDTPICKVPCTCTLPWKVEVEVVFDPPTKSGPLEAKTLLNRNVGDEVPIATKPELLMVKRVDVADVADVDAIAKTY